MSEHVLRHLAVVTGTAPEQPEDIRHAVLASCNKAAGIAREAFALVPGLRAFSWLDPGLDGLLSRTAAPLAASACAAGARALAVGRGPRRLAAVCGRRRRPARRHSGPAGARDSGRCSGFSATGGRDEIVRAAGRFLAAHPGRALADDELDAWLDTAGIPDPDLLLYVGGSLEPRDVLLWQGSYAEISHTTEPMSSFSAAGLRRAVSDYFERQRRFGR
jgi:hypothetical protein